MKILIIAIILLSINSAQAFIVEVKSGEHAGFSRLVFYHPKNVQLEAQALGNQISIGAGNSISTLQADGVFARISKNRISDVRLDSGRIFVDLTCECETQLSKLEPGISFIDIGIDLSSTQETSIVKSSEHDNHSDRHPILPIIIPSGRKEPIWLQSENSKSTDLTEMETNIDNSQTDKDILNAFISGISEASLRKTEGADGRKNLEVNPTTASHGGFTKLEFLKYEGSPFRSANDKPACTNGRHLDNLLDFSNFGELKYEHLANLRKSAITGAMEFYNEGAISLAKFYLSNGLLEEADQYIDWMEDTVEKIVLQEVSTLLKLKTEGEFPALENASTCSKKSEFWLFLQDSKNTLKNADDITGLALYFRSLPNEMLKLIQPILTRKVTQAGFPEANFIFDLATPKSTSKLNEDIEKEEITLSNSSNEESESDNSATERQPMSLEERLDSEIDLKLSSSPHQDPERNLQLANRLLDDGNIIASISQILKLNSSLMTDAVKKPIYDTFFQNLFLTAEESDLLLLDGTSEYENFLDILRDDQRMAISKKIDAAEEVLSLDTSQPLAEASDIQPTENESGTNDSREMAKALNNNPAWAEFYEILGKSESVRQEAVELLER